MYRNGGGGLGDWSFSQTIAPGTLEAGDNFGNAVALSGGGVRGSAACRSAISFSL